MRDQFIGALRQIEQCGEEIKRLQQRGSIDPGRATSFRRSRLFLHLWTHSLEPADQFSRTSCLGSVPINPSYVRFWISWRILLNQLTNSLGPVALDPSYVRSEPADQFSWTSCFRSKLRFHIRYKGKTNVFGPVDKVSRTSYVGLVH